MFRRLFALHPWLPIPGAPLERPWAREHATVRLPRPIFFTNKESLFTDSAGHHWRAFEYLENTSSPPVANTLAQAYATAHTFASFTAAFGGFDASRLVETIPGFHDLGHRFHEFEQALRIALPERKLRARDAIAALLGRQQYKNFYAGIIASPALYPKRVMHHDAKIANVLFEKGTGQVVCPVDFDTVMPGYFFSDLGDMIRSMACTEDENCTDLTRIRIREDYYDAIVSGYLQVMGPQLTKEEMGHIHYSGILMIYMQALRFLTDYLNGDIYYQIDYPEQNLFRANNQLMLLEQLEIHLKFPEPSIAVHHFPAK